MNNYSFKKGGKIYRRISKATARKLHAQRIPFCACPCKYRPGAPWYPEFSFRYDVVEEGNFDAMIAYITGLECIGNETGRYLAYYAEEDVL